MKKRTVGISIVEILVSIAIFSTALVGMYMAVNGLNRTITTSMKRDIENAYANMLMSEVNLYDRDVETAYDLDSTEAACSNKRCSQQLPNGETVYYTRRVESTPAEADVKITNLYLYRADSGGSPFRRFRKEYAPRFFGCAAQGSSGVYYKDATGRVFNKDCAIVSAAAYQTVAGGIKWGADNAVLTGAATISTVTVPSGTRDPALFMSAAETNVAAHKIGWAYPATSDQAYSVELGFNEFDGAAVGDRVFDIYINNKLVAEDFDINDEAGGQNKALVKIYSVLADDTVVENSVPLIKIRLEKKSGTQGPLLCYIAITRNQ